MKWIVILLMIANVAIYLWASQHQESVNEVTINPKSDDFNKDGMLTLSEVENMQQSVSEIVDLGKKPTKETESSVTASKTVQRRIDSTNCYQLGPFKKEESWQADTQWMEQNQIVFRRIISDSRELQVVRVFLGPYQTMASAESAERRLKSEKQEYFDKYYDKIYRDENDAIRISLGYFTQEELANKLLVHLNSIDIPAKSQLEYRQLGSFNWLVITIDKTNKSRVMNRRWIEPVVGLSQIAC